MDTFQKIIRTHSKASSNLFFFLFFRDVFFVQEPVLVVPKLYINIPSCVLRIINNDSDEELPRVFMRVAPRIWPKNKVTV